MKNISLSQASEMLMLALAKNEGPKSLIQLAGEIMDNPVALGDTSLTVHFISENMPESVPMSHTGIIPPDFSTDNEFIKYNEAAYYSEKPVLTPPQYGGYQTIITRLTVHRQITGYLSVLMARHPVRENDMALVCLIRDAVQAELGKNPSAFFPQSKPWDHTLKRLLSGLKNPLHNNADLTISLGLEKNTSLYVIVFKILGYSKANTPALAITRTLMDMCGTKLCVLFDGNIVLIRQGPLHLLPAFSEPCRQMNGYLANWGIIGGVSACFFQISDLYVHYRQAADTIEFFAPGKGAGIYRYESAATFLFLKEHKDRLEAYCHPGVLRLLDYDRQNRTDYVKVLKIYAQTGKNVQITAEKMHLSKASIYRILERIKKITEQNFESPQCLFNLYFSIILMDYEKED
ncbi:helix-turn-helix domain-containing protein [Catenibacillus scindens]|uniref:helix-turn-helix domain-containing protein n=1 Tax=Catenibacillus scindens TaxID=673271 RepID=UPI0032087DFF